MKAEKNEIILHNTEDGKVQLEIILDKETQTIWLTQLQMAELYNISVKTINEHLINIFNELELLEDSTIRKFRIVRSEGKREVTREVGHYNLKAILAVGYRVRSERGVQFRKWATDQLAEYLTKGFLLNDKRLKDPGGWDYFDELLERIRDIRTSEKRFYQKVRDIFAQTSVDYDKNNSTAKDFFATIQNKLIFAETGKTAAELIVARADSNEPNMGLTNFEGSKVRKRDATISKNYLNHDEITSLNRLITMFLDYAEDRAAKRKEISMKDWIEQTNKFLDFNERDILEGSGKQSRTNMETYIDVEFEKFSKNRKQLELEAAEEEYLVELAELEETIKQIEKKK